VNSVHKEVNAGKLLSHESIIQYVEVFETISSIYMVLEYFEGKDLFAIMEGRLYKPLSESSAKNIFKQLISAVSYCHSVGVAHRDIKLENIMMNAL
jgi:serine/threonine protein kinase